MEPLRDVNKIQQQGVSVQEGTNRILPVGPPEA